MAQFGAWRVFASILSGCLCETSPAGPTHTSLIEFLRLPIPLLATPAEALYDALFDQSPIRHYTTLANLGLEMADYAVYHVDRDGAANNDQLLARAFSEFPARACLSDRVCGSHINNLCELSAVTAIDSTIVAVIYSISLLFRKGGYFSRIIFAVDVAVKLDTFAKTTKRGSASWRSRVRQ